MNIPFYALEANFKKKLACFYFIVGKEIVLIDKAAEMIIKAITQNKANEFIEKRTMWLESNQDWENLYISMQYNPMFSSQEIIHAKYQKNTLDKEANSYLQKIINIVAENRLVILEAPNLNAKIFEKFFANLTHAHFVQIAQFNQRTFLDYIKTLLIEENINYTGDVPNLIAYFSQGNAIAAKQCVSQCKLLLGSKDNTINENVILEVLHDTATFPLYTFADTCIKGDAPQVLRQLKILQQSQIEPSLLLWWLNKITKELLIINYKLVKGESFSMICKELKIWQTQESIYRAACKRLNSNILKNIILYLGKIDLKIKSNFTNYLWDDFERVAITLCQPEAVIYVQQS